MTCFLPVLLALFCFSLALTVTVIALKHIKNNGGHCAPEGGSL